MFSVIPIHFDPLHYLSKEFVLFSLKSIFVTDDPHCVIVSQNYSANLRNEIKDNLKVVTTTSEL